MTTVDSGACDSIAPPETFKNTPITRTSDYGKSYGACGGEDVTNLGTKFVKALIQNGNILDIPFQVGDKITRPLTAVSQLALQGKSIWFGKGPKFESYIIEDPDAFVVFKGKPIKLICATVFTN